MNEARNFSRVQWCNSRGKSYQTARIRNHIMAGKTQIAGELLSASVFAAPPPARNRVGISVFVCICLPLAAVVRTTRNTPDVPILTVE
jgi:hypothetical protein